MCRSDVCANSYRRSTRWGLGVTALGIALTLLLSSPALAANPDAKERAARRACLAGDYMKGVAILADLFVATKDTVFIFNQGRCFEQNGHYEEAIARFREYLIKTSSPSSEERATAEKHIAACESYLAKGDPEKVAVPKTPQAAPPSPSEPPIAPQAVSASVPPPNETPLSVKAATERHAASDPAVNWRTGGIITGSVGVASLIAGLVLNLRVNSMTADLEKPNNYNRSTNSTRQTYKTMGWIAYGVGGAAVAAGAALYAIGLSKHSSSDATISLAPALAPGATGITMTGAF